MYCISFLAESKVMISLELLAVAQCLDAANNQDVRQRQTEQHRMQSVSWPALMDHYDLVMP